MSQPHTYGWCELKKDESAAGFLHTCMVCMQRCKGQDTSRNRKGKLPTYACMHASVHASAGQDACMVFEEHLVYHATDTGDVWVVAQILQKVQNLQSTNYRLWYWCHRLPVIVSHTASHNTTYCQWWYHVLPIVILHTAQCSVTYCPS